MAGLKLTNNSETSHYPAGWVHDHECLDEEFRLFATRFRIARAFEGIKVADGIASKTIKGYEALLRLLLAYSAYERFEAKFRLAGKKKRREVEQLHNRDGVSARILKDRNLCEPLFSLLTEKTQSGSLKANAQSLFESGEGSLVHLAEAVRHVFVHGQFTPGSWKQNPVIATEIFDELSDYLLRIMDAETGPRMEKMGRTK